MHAATDRLEFAPPPQPAFLRSLSLAVAAHLLLLAALTWGVHWKRDSENLAVEAELWSALPQQAAPKLVEAPPAPPPPPPEKVEVKPPPPPVVKDADIALEREKKRRELEKEKQRALEEKLEQKKKAEAEAEKKKQEAREKQLEKDKQEKKELEAKRKADADARQQKDADAKRQEAQRLENIKRAQGLAGASGSPTAAGTALQSSGPSAGYGGRLEARVRPNIVFPDLDVVQGNPAAEVEVRTAPDGTIVGTPRLVKSSGNKAWDEAVLRAIEKTEVMPRDADGRVPSPFPLIVLRPKRQ